MKSRRHRAVAIGDTSRKLAPRSIALSANQEVFTVPMLEAKLSAQLQGIGAGTLPECLAEEHLQRGALVRKDVTGMRDVTQFYLAWRDDQTGHALRWWVEQLDCENLIDEASRRQMAAASGV